MKTITCKGVSNTPIAHKGVAIAAALAVAMVFTLSACSSDDDEGNSGGCSPSVQYCDGGGESPPLTYKGQTYRTVKIGTQIWMAENFNYNATGSRCYDNLGSSCVIYGRLYDWATAMAVCPSGWHLPSSTDWDKLMHYVDGSTGTSSPYKSNTAGRYLKAANYWRWSSDGYGDDSFGFSALPGGYCHSDGDFYGIGNYGIWWSADASSIYYAYYRRMDYDGKYVSYGFDDTSYLLSVRCVKD
jgi:uncharacterized protein (TIGR02145 family)